MDPKLLNAAKNGNVDALQEIAEKDAELLLGATPFGNTALHIAVRFEQQKFIEEICARKPALLRERNKSEETALHTAAIMGSYQAVEFFLGLVKQRDEESGDVEPLMRMVDEHGNNTLHAALLNGHDIVAKWLVSADSGLAACVNKGKESPLYLAAMRGFLDIVKLLLQCDQCDHIGPHGQTALHAAVIEGHLGIADELLKKKNEFIKEKDDKGKTPLHHAVTRGDLKMVQLLLKYDSSAVYVADSDGYSPFHLCAREGHVAIFGELFKSCPDAVDALDSEGRNVLHIATKRGSTSLAVRLVMAGGFERLLNQRDRKGKTPLHIAAEEPNPAMLLMLLHFKTADMRITDHRGLTAPKSFYVEKNPRLSIRWYVSHSIIRDAWAKHDACNQNFIRKNVGRMEDEQQKKRLDKYFDNVSIVAALMATVTFAAAFTVPGGYVSEEGPEQGLAVLSRKAAIKVFLISDTISMCCSLLTAYLHSTVNQKGHKWMYTKFGSILVSLAFLGMIVAFASGIYAVVAPVCLWLGILICVLCFSLPCLVIFLGSLGFYFVRIITNIAVSLTRIE